MPSFRLEPDQFDIVVNAMQSQGHLKSHLARTSSHERASKAHDEQAGKIFRVLTLLLSQASYQSNEESVPTNM